jgi:hypothetical protein
MSDTNLHSKVDRGGSEEPHPQAGTRAYFGVRRGERRRHPLTWVPGRYTHEGELVLAAVYIQPLYLAEPRHRIDQVFFRLLE